MPSNPLFIDVSADKKNFKIFCFDSVLKKNRPAKKVKIGYEMGIKNVL